MKKSLLLVAFALTLMGVQAQQTTPAPKFDARLERLVSQAERQRATRATADAPLRSQGQTFLPSELLRVTISTHHDAPQLVEAVKEMGGKITAITATYYTAELPIAQLRSIAQRKEVKRIAMPRQLRKALNKARPETGVEKLHKGTELSTPFTGKGVVLGVIDQGFQFDHIAFKRKDGTSRIRVGWNRRLKNSPATPPTTLPANEKDDSHATHVASIAGGSNWDNGYQGVAPDAELVLIASSFETDKIAEEVRYVSDFAKKENKPWVVNMSFGSQFGPHDGTTYFDQAMDSLLGPGALIAGAMGNEGGRKLHARATLQPGETRYLFVEPPYGKDSYEKILYGVWGPANAGTQHITFTPVVSIDETVVELPESLLKEAREKSKSLEDGIEVEDSTNKQVYWAYYDTRAFLEDLVRHHLADNDPWLDFQVGVRIQLAATAPAPEEIHGWTEVEMGSISRVEPEGAAIIEGDDDYLVGEGAASIPRAIAVASYATSTTWKAVADGNYTMNSDGKLNDISSFSSKGPWLGTGQKPTIAAPGSMISAAINGSSSEWERSGSKITAPTVTHIQTINNKKYYYGAMEGTSMATPFMSGVLCLWLEANPKLTPEQAIDILRTTARRDNFTGTQEWSPSWGYGKIDAYAGLKKALELAKTTGIERPNHAVAPFTLSKEDGRCRLLFNNAEAWAAIRLFNAEGRLLQQRQLNRVQQGQEEIISTEGFAPGIYLLQLQSPAARTTHRIVVR